MVSLFEDTPYRSKVIFRPKGAMGLCRFASPIFLPLHSRPLKINLCIFLTISFKTGSVLPPVLYTVGLYSIGHFLEHEFFSLGRLGSSGKGQLISKCLFGAIVSTKKPTKFFKEFWP